MNDVKDRILDSCLEEALGGQSPPDFTSQVMQLLNGQAAAPSAHVTASTNLAIAESPVIPSPAVQVSPKRFVKRKNRNTWLNAALTASVLAAFVSVGALAFRIIDRSHNTENSLATSPQDRGVTSDKRKPRPPELPSIGDGRLVKQKDANQPNDATANADGSLNRPTNSANQLATDDLQGPEDSEVVALINRELWESWRRHDVLPAEQVPDQTWCHRVYQALLGREPSSDELAAFVADETKQKRETLVDRLLNDPAYTDQFAAHFASVWNDLLIAPAGGSRKGDLASRDGLQHYLKESFYENKPLDEMAHDLISATGSGSPGAADFNGAANFLLAHFDRRGTTATAHTARVFLGSRVKCAQCHDHAAGDQQLAQRDFWQLNAFFRQVDFERGASAGEFALVDRDFDGEGDDPSDAEVYFETPEGRLQVAYPVFENESIPTSGYVDQVNRRRELARLITNSDRFGQTVVNHFWKAFFAYGLPASRINDAQLVDGLAEELRASGYDAKRLVRWIALSEAFALADRAPAAKNEIDSPEFGGEALFSRFYQRKSVAEPVSSGLAAAVKAHRDGSVNARMLWYGRFIPQDPSSVPTLGSDLVVPLSAPPVIGFDDLEMIRKIEKANLTYAEKVHHLFWATVTRNPSQQELKFASELHGANSENPFAALEAIWLVLTNSDECVLE